MNAPNPAQTFLLEAEDLLAQIEETALEAERHPADTEAINRLFRAFHTIKGSGAMFGFEAVAGFTHHVETVLDQVRAGRIPLTNRLIELILAARDHIKALFDDPVAAAAASPQIVAAFEGIAASQPSAPAGGSPPASAVGGMTTWKIRFRPPLDVALTGANPLALLDELRGLGACEVTACTEAVPPLETLQPEQCHLAWDIVLTTDRGLNAIKDVFIFVEDGSELSIAPVAAAAPAPMPAVPVEAPPKAAASGRKHIADTSVRVSSDRLDRLVGIVGELVMNQSRLNQVAARGECAELNAPAEVLERLIGELRDTVLGIRMMPIGTTFNRFKRLVHDLSAELDKEIDLVTEGAETELDKTVLDQLGDPLIHLIRNSVDHGIESPEERVRQGKPRRGTIRLSAAHTGSNVVITIQDDGRGLDTAAIRAKAIERKLIPADANPSQREIFNLILLPGFSTAKQVTSVSGRGVGMDVVKREIDALRGSLQIASQPGEGTTIAATLPLTLAIIDGLRVEIGTDQFIVPMAVVLENFELSRAERCRHNGRNTIVVRGELVSYIRLRETFGIVGEGPDVEKVVVMRYAGERVGLVVDRVLGSHQTVIQSLGRFYRGIEALSGATIMGDGRVALILDIGGLLRTAERAAAACVSTL